MNRKERRTPEELAVELEKLFVTNVTMGQLAAVIRRNEQLAINETLGRGSPGDWRNRGPGRVDSGQAACGEVPRDGGPLRCKQGNQSGNAGGAGLERRMTVLELNLHFWFSVAVWEAFKWLHGKYWARRMAKIEKAEAERAEQQKREVLLSELGQKVSDLIRRCDEIAGEVQR